MAAMNEFNTYHGWIRQGRQVMAGQSADEYFYYPSGMTAPCFRIDQTMEFEQEDSSTAERISVEEHKERKKTAAPGPRIKIKLRKLDNGKVRFLVWCGSNRRAIDLMKKSEAAYDQQSHRWTFVREDPSPSIHKLRAAGYVVEIEEGAELVQEDPNI